MFFGILKSISYMFLLYYNVCQDVYHKTQIAKIIYQFRIEIRYREPILEFEPSAFATTGADHQSMFNKVEPYIKNKFLKGN